MDKSKFNNYKSLQELIVNEKVDYLDFGCSKGGSLKLGRDLFGGESGLGIDIDENKVLATRSLGYNAVQADATNLGISPGSVSFILLLHFIEHLPGFNLAQTAIQSACMSARDFVYIRHPWFDSDSLLFDFGLKFYWSDWTGHPNHFGKIQFHNVLSRNPRVFRWWMFGCDPVTDTGVKELIKLNAEKNSQGASPDEISAREPKKLPTTAYKQLACFIQINKHLDTSSIFARFRNHTVIYDSAAST